MQILDDNNNNNTNGNNLPIKTPVMCLPLGGALWERVVAECNTENTGFE
jgi:hypothetical protein